MKDSFYSHAKEGLTFSVAIPLGFIGFVIPQTINRQVLGIPDKGLVVDL